MKDGSSPVQNRQGANNLEPAPIQYLVVMGGLGPNSTRLACPNCRADIMTRVERINTTTTHLLALVLCLVAFPCCLCFLPYVMNSTRGSAHYCPACGAYLGIHDI